MFEKTKYSCALCVIKRVFNSRHIDFLLLLLLLVIEPVMTLTSSCYILTT